MATDATDGDWSGLGIVCPSCGNCGDDPAVWSLNGHTPFRLIEDVARSWIFTARRALGGGLMLIADANRDTIDWESGSNRRLECVQCLAQFPLYAEMTVDFE